MRLQIAADQVLVTHGGPCRVILNIQGVDPSDLLELLIEHYGANAILKSFDTGDICDYLKSKMVDPDAE